MTFARKLMAVALAGASMTLAGPTSLSQAATDEPTLLGFATGDFRTELPQFTSAAGRPPAIYQIYWSLELGWAAGNNAWAQGILTDIKGFGSVPYIEITTNSLSSLTSGAKDADLNALAKTLADWIKAGTGRRVLIAPLPEMNLPEHPWGGDPARFKSGYQRIRQAFLDRGLGPSQVRFVFAPNGVNGQYDMYYPGDAVADVIGFAKINRGSPWRNYETTFQMHIEELQATVSIAKPILITQTGSVTAGGNRSEWLDAMFTNLKANDQVIGAIYFNRNKDVDLRVLAGGALDQTFRNGYPKWSAPSEVAWIFDGRMDAWVVERRAAFGSGFVDTRGHIFEASIQWLADEAITQGCNPPLNTRFCPDDDVTRGEMAVFLVRALGLPQEVADHFSDDKGAFYENAANRLFEAGITTGCGPRRFCGGLSIARDQMAAFLARALGLPSASKDFFTDDETSELEGAINKIARSGITLGCNPPSNTKFCPDAPVNRGQMAAFLRRALAS